VDFTDESTQLKKRKSTRSGRELNLHLLSENTKIIGEISAEVSCEERTHDGRVHCTNLQGASKMQLKLPGGGCRESSDFFRGSLPFRKKGKEYLVILPRPPR
jgi:hypothetical protein